MYYSFSYSDSIYRTSSQKRFFFLSENTENKFPKNHFKAYRYGLQGKESDDELKGAGNSYDFGARMLDPRIGRWLSVDAFASIFPNESPYSSFANSPIALIDVDGNYPIKPEVIGVKALIKNLRAEGVASLTDLYSYFGGGAGGLVSDVDANDNTNPGRYLYSEKWGWIDMRHIAAGAYGTDLWYASGEDILNKGETNEENQVNAEPSSAWSYEDLTSNLLGVYFEEYLEDSDEDFLTTLENYLTELGFVENPLSVAPNAAEIPSAYPNKKETPPTATEKHYLPKYTTKKRNGSLDNEVLDRLYYHLGDAAFTRALMEQLDKIEKNKPQVNKEPEENCTD